MKKKKLFVLDTDSDFQTLVKSLCSQDQVEIRFYSSSLEIISSVGKEKPESIFVSLDIPDINDFVMYDVLKKTNDKSIPVFITYSDQSEKEIHRYKKLKFQAQGYYKKPLSPKDLSGIMEKYLEPLEKEDQDEFSDENIDMLVQGKLVDVPVKPKTKAPPDETEKELDLMTEIPESNESKAYRPPKTDTHEWKLESEKNLRNQLIALERQNESLKNKNQELSNTIAKFKGEIEKGNTGAQEREIGFSEEIENLKSYSEELENQNSNLSQQLKKTEGEKSALEVEIKGLNDQLTDKERELVARNYEFEKSLKKQSDELIQAAEEHLLAEFKKKESIFIQQVKELNDEKNQVKTTLENELAGIKQSHDQLQKDYQDLRKQEDSLNRTVSTLAGEKVALSEKITTLEPQVSQLQKELKEKTDRHLSDLEKFDREMEGVLHQLDFYKNRIKELGELLQQALSLTRVENHPAARGPSEDPLSHSKASTSESFPQ